MTRDDFIIKAWGLFGQHWRTTLATALGLHYNTVCRWAYHPSRSAAVAIPESAQVTLSLMSLLAEKHPLAWRAWCAERGVKSLPTS